MVTEEECITLYQKYGNLKYIFENLCIDIVEKEFKQKTLESRLLIDEEGTATVFVLPNISEHHLQFLLAHELGHYIIHFDTNIKFSYYYRIYKTKIEKEANDFACRLLLSDIEITDYCDYVYMEKGIPQKIWYSYIENKSNYTL